VEDVVAQKSADGKSEKRSMADVQAEIEETRQRLADNLTQLKTETKPQVIAARVKESVSGVFTDPETGELRRERVIAVASVAVALLVLRRGVKARHRRAELRRLSEVVWVPVPRSAVSSEFMPVARRAAELGPAPLPALVAAG
jgi:hypothetical protein